HIFQAQLGILRLRFGPRGECADNLLTEQRHEMIAFTENYKARRYPDPAHNVQYGVCVTVERSNADLPGDDRPDKRLSCLCNCILRCRVWERATAVKALPRNTRRFIMANPPPCLNGLLVRRISNIQISSCGY